MSQIRQLVEQLDSTKGSIDCSQSTKGTLRELYKILSEGPKDVCYPDKVFEIREHYLKYISTADRMEDDAPDQIEVSYPTALRNFYLVYGLKVSSAS